MFFSCHAEGGLALKLTADRDGKVPRVRSAMADAE